MVKFIMFPLMVPEIFPVASCENEKVPLIDMPVCWKTAVTPVNPASLELQGPLQVPVIFTVGSDVVVVGVDSEQPFIIRPLNKVNINNNINKAVFIIKDSDNKKFPKFFINQVNCSHYTLEVLVVNRIWVKTKRNIFFFLSLIIMSNKRLFILIQVYCMFIVFKLAIFNRLVVL